MSVKKKMGLDFLADLWSGRVANSIRKLSNTLRRHECRIQTLEELVDNMSQQEQLLTEAAQALTAFGDRITTAIESLITRLQEENITNVDDEIAALQAAVAGIGAIADNIDPMTPTGPQEDVSVDPVTPPAPEGEVPGNPTAPQPVPQEDPAPPTDPATDQPTGGTEVPSETPIGDGGGGDGFQ